MKKTGKTNSIGLAGGVLSAAGLCIGIISLAKKSPVRMKSYGVSSLRETPVVEVTAEEEVQAEAYESPIETLELQSPVASAKAAAAGRPDTVGEERSARQAIFELANQGESVVAIAQVLGISTGEVQLTLRLRQRSASAGF
jgi:hypothetical protein